MAFAPDGRVFVTEQAGNVRVIKNGSLLTTPFVTVNAYTTGEAGLNGIAIDPDFTVNGYIYLYYTVRDNQSGAFRNQVVRYTANGDVALTGSEKVILALDPLNFAEQHNGGAMRFGPDGKLYIGVGDSHFSENAQDLDTYKGKLLRINSDGSAPADNPFPTGSEQRKRVWAYGLRNPFTFTFQAGTGRLFVNDVGEGAWEEVNEATTPGLNFGWPLAEGNSANPDYTNPVFAYPHVNDQCSIVGGVFFNPAATNYPASYIGKYFYNDYCTGQINMLDLSTGTVTSTNFSVFPSFPVGLEVGPDGNIYFLARYFKALYKIIYSNNAAPDIVTQPASLTVPLGQPAGFSVTATGSATLQFQWQKDGSNIQGATSSSYSLTSTSASDAGQYQVIVSNNLGSKTSQVATLSFSSANQLPIPVINMPTNHAIYRAGDVITFSGSATDGEDGILPASAFVWTVEFHHNTHYHPGPQIASGLRNGQFTIPNQGETATDVFYRLILTVIDSQGASNKTYIDLDPRLVSLTLDANPSGLPLYLDGQPITTPYQQQFVSGLQIGLTAPTTSDWNGLTYKFDSWTKVVGSDNLLIIPDNNATYTATYVLPQDLTPIISARPSTLSGTANFSVIGDVFEVNAQPTSGPVIVKVTKDSRVKLTFNPAVRVSGGRSVDNSAWAFDDASDPYYYVLTATQTMSAGSVLSFGLDGMLTPGLTTGSFTVSMVIVAGSGGEVATDNNVIANKIEYFQK